jgi:hypothetical protein
MTESDREPTPFCPKCQQQRDRAFADPSKRHTYPTAPSACCVHYARGLAARSAQPAPRDPELALKEITECLERQLPQGVENAARHVLACLDEFGRK